MGGNVSISSIANVSLLSCTCSKENCFRPPTLALAFWAAISFSSSILCWFRQHAPLQSAHTMQSKHFWNGERVWGRSEGGWMNPLASIRCNDLG